MCPPVATSMAIGAATGALGSAITGGDPLQGAMMGAVTSGIGYGISPASFGVGTDLAVGKAFTTQVGSFIGRTFLQPLGISGGLGAAALLGSATTSLVGGVAMNMLAPKQQDYSQYYQGAYNPIAYNTQQSQITGSGGRQAPALLASEIKRAKKRREGQAAQGELGLATSLSNTGLQIA